MPDWVLPLAGLIGSIGGAYLGVKVALASLEARIAYLEREVGLTSEEGLRWDRHKHAGFIQDLEGRVDRLERKQ